MSHILRSDLTFGDDLRQASEKTELCGSCAATNEWVRAKRLMAPIDVVLYLGLSYEQVESLIKTRQITTIRIKGESRFDSRELDLLIDTYKKTARRRA